MLEYTTRVMVTDSVMHTFPDSNPNTVDLRYSMCCFVLACTRRHLGIRVTVSVQPLTFTRVPVAEWENAKVISI